MKKWDLQRLGFSIGAHRMACMLEPVLAGYHNFLHNLIPPTFVGPHLKLVIINLISLDIHSVSKITLSIHNKKEAPDLSATDGRGMKPKIQGCGFMATFSYSVEL
jgi:hypothetical protein